MRHTNTNQPQEGTSVLATLRHLIPDRPLQPHEALRIAELQANRLLELSGNTDQPAGAELVTGLPRIQVEYRRLPTSGLSYWNGREWVIGINRSEPETRQRFTLLHEFKHIIDHGRTHHLYGNNPRLAEQAADYFAGCALMPKRLVKSAWGQGIQRTEDLAQTFDVSEPAIRIRLAQLRLAEPERRCTPPADTRSTFPPRGRRYYRPLSPVRNSQEVAA
jgi:Zn-dependent peptidase ImmA (M78 family)